MKYTPLNYVNQNQNYDKCKYVFREANETDLSALATICSEREGSDFDLNVETFGKEIFLVEKRDLRHKLFVSSYSNQVTGYCRYFHSELVPKTKLLFDGPAGYYNMGITIHKDKRRLGFGKFLGQERLKFLLKSGVKEVFSAVSADNLASIKYHESLKFEKIDSQKGFLSISFDCGKGFLFRKKLNVLS